MKDFKYNWATAEMIIMYLRNSRAQEKHKAHNAVEVSTAAQDTPTVTSGSTRANHSSDLDSEDSSDDSL